MFDRQILTPQAARKVKGTIISMVLYVQDTRKSVSAVWECNHQNHRSTDIYSGMNKGDETYRECGEIRTTVWQHHVSSQQMDVCQYMFSLFKKHILSYGSIIYRFFHFILFLFQLTMIKLRFMETLE